MTATLPAATDSGRGRIMDVAASLFVQRGYEATSLRHIADSVGMKAGSLYYHFASKDDLLTEVLQRGMDVMEAAFDEAADATTGRPAPERIGAHVRAHLAALYENGPYTATHVTAFRTAPDTVRDLVVPLRDAYEARWTELLDELRADGSIDDATDLNIARLTLFGAMNSSVEWFDTSRGSLDRFAATITHQFWNGISRAMDRA